MQCGVSLNVVAWESVAILWLFPCKNQTLLVRWDAILVLDFSSDLLSGVTGLNLKGDGLPFRVFPKIYTSAPAGEAALLSC